MPPDAQVPGAAPLTIGELARRTGVGVATLRMWEARHGFPLARRLPSGHRRYDERTVEQVRQVQRRRDAGVRLESAIGEVVAASDIPAPSVYAELRARHPTLAPQRLRKSTLLGLTWALEDECVSRSDRPWLFGAFQTERFYRQAERRWRDLAATSRRAWVLADFPQSRTPPPPAPVEVALPSSAAMVREWSLVCLAADYPAVLTAWELPGQEQVKDGDRVFDSLWTLDPAAVRDGARCCLRVMAELGHTGPDTDAVEQRLAGPPEPPVDLQQATGLFNRAVAYVDRVR